MRTLRIAFALAVVLAFPARGESVRLASIDAAPWAHVTPETGAQSGVLPAIAAELEGRTGHRIMVDLMSLARLERELRTGAYDAVIVLWSESRAGVVERGEPVYDMPFGIIARKGVAVRAYRDLAPLRVSVIRGLSIAAEFDGDAGLAKDMDLDYRQGLRKLAHGRVDAVAGAIPTIRHLARVEGLDSLLGEQLVLNNVPLTLQWARNSPRRDLLPQFNRAIAAMRRDGTLARLFGEHYGFPAEP